MNLTHCREYRTAVNGEFAPIGGAWHGAPQLRIPHHPFDPTAPAISRDKPLIVGTNKDEMAFCFFERKENEVFTLTDDGLKARLEKEFGPNAEKIQTTYRKSRPGASRADLYVAITAARALWLGSIQIAEKKYEQKRRRWTCTCSRTNRI